MRNFTASLFLAVATLCAAPFASAQECPSGFPVDCGTFCCESGAYCSGDQCLIDSGSGGECPSGFPVDCGTFCCESGAYCSGDQCLIDEPTSTDCCTSANSCGWDSDGACDCGGEFAWDQADCGSTETCPSGFPVDCGTFCCESGASCSGDQCVIDSPTGECCTSANECGWDGDGTCDCSGSFAWDDVDCGVSTGGCCTSANECGWDGDGACDCDGVFSWDAVDCGGTTTGECPAGYPVDCGTFCCESGASCSGDQCVIDAPAAGGCCTDANACAWSNDGVCDCGGAYAWDSTDCDSGTSIVGVCPAGYPVDCGPFCCPSGASCGVDTCLDGSGAATTASFAPMDGATCSSDSVTSTNGTCAVEYCIETFTDGCVGYYIINGVQISCSTCAADEACASRAAAACGAGTGTPDDTVTVTDMTPGGCCTEANSCGWDGDGTCDCDGAFGWDAVDCATSTDTGCCTSDNTCNWDGDGTCDCNGAYSWDSVDCAGSEIGTGTGCCTTANECNWENDGTCDCNGAFSWDKRDCNPKGCGMEPAVARRGAGWLTLALLGLSLVSVGARRR